MSNNCAVLPARCDSLHNYRNTIGIALQRAIAIYHYRSQHNAMHSCSENNS